MHCTRCRTPIPLTQEERCWWCFAPLCGACWETYGCCDHPEADAVNAQIRAHYAQHEPQPPVSEPGE